MTEIKFSPEAVNDLRQIRAYISEELYSEEAAVNTLSNIIKRIRILAQYPECGAPLSSIVNFETDYRFLVCGNYTAFYRVEEQTVYIVRILYGRRNFMQVLFGETKDK